MFAFDYILIVNEKTLRNSLSNCRTLLSQFTKSLQDVYRAAYELCKICNDKESIIRESTKEPKDILGLITFIVANELNSTISVELSTQFLDWTENHEENILDTFKPFVSSLFY